MRQILMAVVGGVLAASTFSLADAGKIATLTLEPVSVRENEFNPKKPPAGMPKLKAPEKAVCDVDLYCSAGAGGGGCPSDDGKSVAALVTSVDVLLHCRITNWIPTGAPKQLVEHESGHQAIVEAYYKKADAIMHEIADAYIGKKIALNNGPNVQAELNAALKKVGDDIEAAYKAKMSEVDKTQAKYDAITHFGQTKMQTAVAVKQAFAATNPDIVK